jgi:hypothetical protein
MPPDPLGLLVANTLLFVGFVALGWVCRRHWAIYTALPVAFLLAVGNAWYYLHLSDTWSAYFQYRSYAVVDFTPSLAGFVVGFSFRHARGIVHAPWKAALVALSLYALFLPVAKPLIDPLQLRGPEHRVVDHTIIQRANSTCGPCALAIILDHYGISTSEDEIARACYTSASGTEAWYLARYARSLGCATRFHFDQTSVTPGSIVGITLAGTGHFISILAVDGEHITAHDSTIGRETISRKSLQEKLHFTGMSLVIAPPALP